MAYNQSYLDGFKSELKGKYDQSYINECVENIKAQMEEIYAAKLNMYNSLKEIYDMPKTVASKIRLTNRYYKHIDGYSSEILLDERRETKLREMIKEIENYGIHTFECYEKTIEYFVCLTDVYDKAPNKFTANKIRVLLDTNPVSDFNYPAENLEIAKKALAAPA